LTSAFALARAGETQRADALVHELERDYPGDALLKRYWLPTIRAAVAIADGDAQRAIELLKPVTPYELGGAGTFINYVYPAYVRGEAYLAARNGAAAAAEFRKLQVHSGIVVNFVTGVLAHLRLARAYRLSGDTAKSKAAYRDFLALWKDADAGIPALEQARKEAAEVQR
jgi:hypothetical protein